MDINYITARAEDDWECACRNTSDQDGFWPCLADGTEVEPVIGGPWDEKLVKCLACERIMDQSTYDPVNHSVKIVSGSKWRLGHEVGADDTDAICDNCDAPYYEHTNEVCPE